MCGFVIVLVFILFIAFILGIILGKIEEKGKVVKNGQMEVELSKLYQKARIELLIGLLPFLIVLIHSIIGFFDGVTFIFSKSYGFDAMFFVWLVDIIVFWWIFLIAIILIIMAIRNFLIIKRKKKVEEKSS